MHITPQKREKKDLIWISEGTKDLRSQKKKSTDLTHSISVIRQIQMIPIAEQDEDVIRKSRDEDLWANDYEGSP